jgi:hypothetical protein
MNNEQRLDDYPSKIFPSAYEDTNWRAITSRCTSLVPSPIVQSLESRQYFSGG